MEKRFMVLVLKMLGMIVSYTDAEWECYRNEIKGVLAESHKLVDDIEASKLTQNEGKE